MSGMGWKRGGRRLFVQQSKRKDEVEEGKMSSLPHLPPPPHPPHLHLHLLYGEKGG